MAAGWNDTAAIQVSSFLKSAHHTDICGNLVVTGFDLQEGL